KLTTFSEASIVLDPFVGSGTTAIAAKKLGRRFIGIDSNQEYAEIALKRLENTTTEKELCYKNKKKESQFMLFEENYKCLSKKRKEVCCNKH
ncbi:MAG: DNA methyltransferase, partial [Candidatus Omnitrophota bacterium]